MFYLSLSNQLHLLSLICFSTAIIIISSFFYKYEKSLALLGSSFFSVLSLALASFLSIRETNAQVFINFANIIFLYIIFLSLAVKTKHQKLMIFIIYMLPVIFILAVINIDSLPDKIVSTSLYVSLLAAGTIVDMFILRNVKDKKSILFWAMLLILFGGLVKWLEHSSFTVYASVLLNSLGFATFLLYFFKVGSGTLSEKIDDAEKKVNAVNKNLDLEVKKRMFEVERSHEKLVNISKTDPLTKALNKAAIFEKIELMITTKSNSEFSILMFDIDKFKNVNDTLGHIAGDKCIKKLALIAGNCLRDIDFLGRFGGDEFLIILPGVSFLQARLIAERFRKKVDETEAPHFTISIGIACYPKDADTLKSLIAVADDGLYISKQKGRNAVSHKGYF